MLYPDSLKQRAKQLANDGISAEKIAELFSKEAEKGQHTYYPDQRTIRNWIRRGKEPTNWIDAYKDKTGKYPPLPDYLV